MGPQAVILSWPPPCSKHGHLRHWIRPAHVQLDFKLNRLSPLIRLSASLSYTFSCEIYEVLYFPVLQTILRYSGAAVLTLLEEFGSWSYGSLESHRVAGVK